MKIRQCAVMWAGLVLLAPAHALEPLPGWDVHGFGNLDLIDQRVAPEAARRTDYLLALVSTVQLGDRHQLWANISQGRETGRSHTQLDWAFLDWKVGADTTLRFGQLRAPLGLLNETRGVQATRDAASLPLLYDEHLGVANGTLRGVAVEHQLGDVSLDAYASLYAHTHDGSQRSRRLGGRVTWDTPLAGLKLMASAYTGRGVPDLGHAEPGASGPDPATSELQRERAWVASVRYQQGAWDVSAEATAARLGDRPLQMAYAQLGYKLSNSFTPFVRAESAVIDTREPSLVDHHQRRVAAGLAWTPSPQWGMRFEWARNRGAASAIASEATTEDAARPRWHEAVLSVNYQF